jgi:hypothetical protein
MSDAHPTHKLDHSELGIFCRCCGHHMLNIFGDLRPEMKEPCRGWHYPIKRTPAQSKTP